MARLKYKVTANDLCYAIEYIDAKIKNEWAYRSDSLKITDYWETIEKSPNEITLFLEKFLKSNDFNKLKTSIRAKRKRATSEKTITISLSKQAHKVLSDHAKKEQITLSDAIIKYLTPAPAPAPAPADYDRCCTAKTKTGKKCRNKTIFTLCDYHRRVESDKQDKKRG